MQGTCSKTTGYADTFRTGWLRAQSTAHMNVQQAHGPPNWGGSDRDRRARSSRSALLYSYRRQSQHCQRHTLSQPAIALQHHMPSA